MRAGALVVEPGEGGLLDIRWGGLRIASSVHVTVRDGSWGTVRPHRRTIESEQRSDSFTLRFDVEHGPGVFAWRGTATGTADGQLTFEVEGEALQPTTVRRVGICVLHPWAPYVGARFQASGGPTATAGVFPHDVGPQEFRDGGYQPMIPAFTRLTLDLAGPTTAVFDLDGEPGGFELEDQRNWTDASFKTYPTPLALSEPRVIEPGERVRQRLELRLNGQPVPEPPPAGEVVIRVSSPSGRLMPPIGVGLPNDPAAIGRVRALGPAHLRTVVGEDPDALDHAIALARSVGVPLEVWSLLDDEQPSAVALDHLRGADVARVLMLRRSGRRTGSDWVHDLRGGLSAGVPIGGGTWSHFSELNRSIPEVTGLDVVGFSMTPAVHDDAEASMVETLEIQPQLVEQVHGSCQVPVVVAVTMADASAPGAAVDARMTTPFAAAWTVGSAAALIDAEVSAISMHEPFDLAVAPGSPLERALELLCARQRRQLLGTSSSDPRRARAIAVQGRPVLVANLTSRDLPIVLEGDVETGETLRPYEVAELPRPDR
jgi:hypothetical protein